MNIGTQVLCINDKFDTNIVSLIPNRPVEEKIYTIRDILLTRNGKAVHLEEITNPPLYDKVHNGTFEPSFNINRFRPILETELELEEHGISTLYI